MGNNVLLKIPMTEKDTLSACQENFRKLQSVSQAVVKVEGDTYAATRDPGKVKVSATDGAANYLEDKLDGGTLTTLTKSTDGATETLTIDVALDHGDVGDMPDTGGTNDDHDVRYVAKVQDAEPTTPPTFPGEIWHDTDARFGTPFNIGDGETGIDYEVVFKGETNEGSYVWMEDEDYLLCNDDLLINSTENIYFRDTAISINSADDGHLDLTADTTIDLNGVTLATNKIAFTQTDLNEYIDSLADGYIDYRATTGHRFGDGTNYAMFAADGELTFVATARVLNAIWVDAGGIKAPGAKPATAIAHGTLETPAWQFGNEEVAGNQETVSFNMRIPNRMDRSVAPTLTIGWSATAITGDVKWALSYLWTKLNQDTTAAAQETLYATTTVSGTAEGLVTSTFIGIDVPDSDDICLHCQLMRMSADVADTLADDCELHGICLQWTSNKLGTAT